MAKKPFNPQDLSKVSNWFQKRMPGSLIEHGERLPGGMSIRGDETLTEADAHFQERNVHLSEQNQHLSPSVMFANLLAVVYPDVPGYGPEHGKNTSQLAVYIAQVAGIHDGTELETLKAAGLLHDIARTAPFTVTEPNVGRRSAEKADRIFRADATARNMGSMREAACRLIALHNLDAEHPPQDPLARALWDADILEAARHAPNSDRGRKEVVERYKRLVHPWCQRPETQTRWLKKYGWNVSEWGFF